QEEEAKKQAVKEEDKEVKKRQKDIKKKADKAAQVKKSSKASAPEERLKQVQKEIDETDDPIRLQQLIDEQMMLEEALENKPVEQQGEAVDNNSELEGLDPMAGIDSNQQVEIPSSEETAPDTELPEGPFADIDTSQQSEELTPEEKAVVKIVEQEEVQEAEKEMK